EVHGRNAGNFQRILEGEEDALGGARVRLHGEQVRALERHRAFGDLVGLLAGEHVRERRLARSVRAHDGVHFALVHGQVEPFEDLAPVDRHVQLLDLQHCHVVRSVRYRLKCEMISAISSLFLAASSPPWWRPSDLPPTSISPCSPTTIARPSEKCPSSGRSSTRRAPSK